MAHFTNTVESAAPSSHSTLTTKTASSPSSSLYPSASSSFAAQPSSSGSASGGNGTDTDGLASYYLVFLALLLCCLGLSVFFIFRRRARMRALRRRGIAPGQGENGVQGGWYGADGPMRWRHGRWDGAETSREEGLDEHGEAPPPYLAKRQSEERRRAEGLDAGGPAIPMETLSRVDVGLKPPDYTESGPYVPGPTASTSGNHDRTTTS